MAVYTRITEQDLKDYLSRFDRGDLISFEGIAEGVENTNYVITTTQSKLILTLFEKRVNREDLPFFITFMEYLRERGIPSSFVAADHDGTRLLPFHGKPALLSEFLPGKWLRTPADADAAKIGETLALMHRAGKTFPLKRRNTLALPAWETLIHAAGKDADRLEKGLYAFLCAELDFLKKNGPKYLPRGAIHADLFPDNVLFLDGNISGVIDFYFSCTDTLAYDLMLTLNAWCFNGGRLDAKKSTGLLKSYQQGRTLTRGEIKALPFFGRAAAMRIIATRLYDALNPAKDALVKPKDPLEHVRILRVHQNIKSAAEYEI